MRLLLDEMWPPAVAAELRERGHEVSAVAESPHLRGRPDEVIFAAALEEARAIVTEDVADFRALASASLRAGRPCPPLIFTSNRRYPRSVRRTAARLVIALETLLKTRDSLDGEHWLD